MNRVSYLDRWWDQCATNPEGLVGFFDKFFEFNFFMGECILETTKDSQRLSPASPRMMPWPAPSLMGTHQRVQGSVDKEAHELLLLHGVYRLM